MTILQLASDTFLPRQSKAFLYNTLEPQAKHQNDHVTRKSRPNTQVCLKLPSEISASLYPRRASENK